MSPPHCSSLLLLLLFLWCCHGDGIAADDNQPAEVYARLGESVALGCPIKDGSSWDRITWENADGRFIGSGRTFRVRRLQPELAGVYVCRKLRFSRDGGPPTAAVDNIRLIVQTDDVKETKSSTVAPPTVEKQPEDDSSSRTTTSATSDEDIALMSVVPDTVSTTASPESPLACLPNQVECGISRRTTTSSGRECILKHWLCDGESDCRNGWDEENCESKEVCSTRTYNCENTTKVIPMGYRCDEEVDCEFGDDEKDCAAPIFKSPDNIRRIYKIEAKSQRVAHMTCTAQGLPKPVIVWRQNGLAVKANHTIEESCQIMPNEHIVVNSKLTVRQIQSDDAGFYTCEANSGSGRTFSSDFLLVI